MWLQDAGDGRAQGEGRCIRVQILMLELHILRRRSTQLLDRGVLTAPQRRRLDGTVADVLDLLDQDSEAPLIHNAECIDQAQNRLFDEVLDVVMAWSEPRRRAG